MVVNELFKLKDNNLKGLKILSEAELSFIAKNGADLITFQKNHALIEYVIGNYNYLSNIFVKKAMEMVSEEKSDLAYPFGDYYLETNSAFLNFLASSRTLLDHMGTNIKKSHGGQSTEFLYFKELYSREFDNNFSYKFMDKLRNFVQHCGMPPLSYTIQKRYDDKNESVTSNLIVMFPRDELLQAYDSWGKHVKPELQHQSSEFPAIPLINEYIYSLIKIYVNYSDKYQAHDILNVKRNLLDIIGEEDGYILGEYSTGYIIPNEENESVSIKLSTIPTPLLEKVNHFLFLKQLLEDKQDTGYILYDELQ